MAHQITIWNPKVELKELEDRVAKLEVDKKVPLHYLLVPKAALKEAGWDEELIEEAIKRGRVLAGGGELTEDPSWETTDDDVPEASEVPGLEATEEEQRVPGRVFNLLGDMGGEESEEGEEVRAQELEDVVTMPAPQTPAEHVAYLNNVNMLKTGNPEWEDYLWTYMKKYELKPSDMEGLVGPRPWKDDPLWSNIEDEEIPEPPYAGVGLAKEKILEAAARETVAEYDKRMFDEYFGDIKKEETMETMTSKDVLMEKAKAHLADTRKRVVVGSDVGWLCEQCNSVWSLEQQICPNRCRKAEPPTVEHRGWPKDEGSGLVADVRFPEEEAGDPLCADPDWLRRHMAACLAVGKSLEEKKDIMADRIKKALKVERLPGEPEPCTLCGAYDGEQCGCCTTCEETEGHCKCCVECSDYPCVCDTTEICPICDKRIPLGDACPNGCDADHVELVKLYDEVKNSRDLKFEEKVRYLSLLKEKMRQYEGEEVLDEPENLEEPYEEELEDEEEI